MPDFEYDGANHSWTHPETGVRILGEDMPWELKPASEALGQKPGIGKSDSSAFANRVAKFAATP